jgi:hypothetical protein
MTSNYVCYISTRQPPCCQTVSIVPVTLHPTFSIQTRTKSCAPSLPIDHPCRLFVDSLYSFRQTVYHRRQKKVERIDDDDVGNDRMEVDGKNSFFCSHPKHIFVTRQDTDPIEQVVYRPYADAFLAHVLPHIARDWLFVSKYWHREAMRVLHMDTRVDFIYDCQYPIQWAAAHGYSDVVECLLRHPDVKPSMLSVDDHQQQPPTTTSSSFVNIVCHSSSVPRHTPRRFILENETLVYAINAGHIHIVQRLLADPRTDPTGKYHLPMQFAFGVKRTTERDTLLYWLALHPRQKLDRLPIGLLWKLLCWASTQDDTADNLKIVNHLLEHPLITAVLDEPLRKALRLGHDVIFNLLIKGRRVTYIDGLRAYVANLQQRHVKARANAILDGLDYTLPKPYRNKRKRRQEAMHAATAKKAKWIP